MLACVLSYTRGIAREAGLRYVYTGNTHDPAGETTLCPDRKIPGHFDTKPGDFGRRRFPVAVM